MSFHNLLLGITKYKEFFNSPVKPDFLYTEIFGLHHKSIRRNMYMTRFGHDLLLTVVCDDELSHQVNV